MAGEIRRRLARGLLGIGTSILEVTEMARNVATIEGPMGEVHITWNADWTEYTVTPAWIETDAVYMTDDLEDAIKTAIYMASRQTVSGTPEQ